MCVHFDVKNEEHLRWYCSGNTKIESISSQNNPVTSDIPDGNTMNEHRLSKQQTKVITGISSLSLQSRGNAD